MGYFNELSVGVTPTPRRLIDPAVVAFSLRVAAAALRGKEKALGLTIQQPRRPEATLISGGDEGEVQEGE
jgi:hypothetical protein